MRFFKFLTLFIFISVCACQTVQSDLPKLKSIKIYGNDQLSTRDIVNHLALDPTSKIPIIGQKRYYDDALLEADLARVQKIYETNGIYGTRIVKSEVSDDEKEVTLSIWVQEGKQILVENVNFIDYPIEEKPTLDLKKVKKFTEEKYTNDKNRLVKKLQDNGYPFAKIDGKVRVDLEKATCDIDYKVTSGNKFRIGKINIVGNKRVSAEQILEQSNLKRGELYSKAEMDNAEKVLTNLSVFRLVEVKTDDPSSEDEVPVTISVDEGSFQMVGLGGGLGVATGRNEVRGRIQYRHNNMFGGLRRFDTELRPAYIMVPSFFDPLRKGWGGQANANLFQPDVFMKQGYHHIGANFSTNYQRDLQDGFTVNSGGFRVGLIWPTNSPSTIEAGYNAEFFALTDYPTEVQQCGTLTCMVSFLDQRFIWDGRDDRVNPREGYWVSLVLNEAGLAGSFRYLSLMPEVRMYFPVASRMVLAMRVINGIMIPEKDTNTPIPKRFYGGGASNHRGFGSKRLSPQVETSGRVRNVPVGGNSMLVSSVEMRVRTFTNFETIAFGDTGEVEEKSFDYRPEKLNHAAGIGFKYESPIAPIRFDVGYRINNPDRFRYEPRWAFHLTLGDAF